MGLGLRRALFLRERGREAKAPEFALPEDMQQERLLQGVTAEKSLEGDEGRHGLVIEPHDLVPGLEAGLLRRAPLHHDRDHRVIPPPTR